MALGVASITSVLMPYRVPAPGESPFGADAGSIGASLAGQVVSSIGTGAVVPFIVAPLVFAFVWGGAWWPVAIVWGPLAGGVIAWWGTSIGGRWYDARRAAGWRRRLTARTRRALRLRWNHEHHS